ncbi:MAG: hypothetical protein QF927_01925 [Verrucomicrobiota bacterium]|nr:hypothetical protein [Verrucomicrobiota bacterium]MDP7012718.1 hypothetical protein [Verrucomicrobiota bacterium]
MSTKRKGGASKRRQISDAIEIAKDYRTDVYWEGEVVWRYADWARQSGDRRDMAAVA